MCDFFLKYNFQNSVVCRSHNTNAHNADDELFAKAARLSNHVLHSLLPPPSTASQRYDLRQRIHSLQL